jgi:DNA-binding NarL/FixJ family response regulator
MQIAVALLTMVMIVMALGVSGYLFISLKRDMHLLDRKRMDSAAAGEAAIQMVRKEVGEFANQIVDLRKELELMPAPGLASAASAGINLNKRTQALRMMRLGQDSEQIAAALSLPRKEIELLAKVQKLLFDASSHTTTS